MHSKDKHVAPWNNLLLECRESDSPSYTQVNTDGPTTMEFPQGAYFASSNGNATNMENFEKRP